MPFVVPHSDEEIRNLSEEEIVRDCLPGNYIPTPDQADEITAEIIRALRIKWSVKAEPIVGRRSRFLQAFKAEIKQWKRLSNEEESMLRMFCACVAVRMRGEDPATLLERRDETMVADCGPVAVG